MKAKSFEELRIFQQARALANEVFLLTKAEPMRRDYSFCDQIRRAAVSVVSNIVEGFERGTNAEFARALYIAKGSSGEVRAQLMLAADQKHCARAPSEQLIEKYKYLSSAIYRLIQYLGNSQLKKRTGN